MFRPRLGFARIGAPVEDRSAEDDARHVLGVRLVILECEDGPPRMTVDKPLLDLERASKRVKFLDEARNVHQRGVGEPIRLPGTQLVIADDGPIVPDILEGLEVVAPRPRAAVQENHRGPVPGAGYPVPDAPATNRKQLFAGPERGTGRGGGGTRWRGRGAARLLAAGGEEHRRDEERRSDSQRLTRTLARPGYEVFDGHVSSSSNLACDRSG